jgi:hypothetical protein
MKMFIPEIGTTIKLTEDWKFSLAFECRNKTVFSKLGVLEQNHSFGLDQEACKKIGLVERNFPGQKKSAGGWWADHAEQKAYAMTLKKDTVLKIERLYIRNGADDFSSVTFKIIDCPSTPKLAKGRFWAKLYDVNQLEVGLVENTTKNPYIRTIQVKDKILNHEEIQKIIKSKRTYHSFYFDFHNQSGELIASVNSQLQQCYYYKHPSYEHQAKYNKLVDKSYIYLNQQVADGKKNGEKTEFVVLEISGYNKKLGPPAELKSIPCKTSFNNDYFVTIYSTMEKEVVDEEYHTGSMVVMH